MKLQPTNEFQNSYPLLLFIYVCRLFHRKNPLFVNLLINSKFLFSMWEISRNMKEFNWNRKILYTNILMLIRND